MKKEQVEIELVAATADYQAMIYLIGRGIVLCKLIPDPKDGYWFTLYQRYDTAVKAYQAEYPAPMTPAV